jgi:hypothetical protein
MKKSVIKKNSDFIKKKKLLTKTYIQKLLTCNEKDCAIYNLNKDGNLINPNKGYLANYLQLLNLLNNIFSYTYIKFPLLYGRNEQDILDKISILNQCTQERIVFYIVNKKKISNKNILSIQDIYEKNKFIGMVFLKHSNIEKFVKVYFLEKSMNNEIANFQYVQKNIEEKLAYYYLSQSLMTYDQPKDSIISVQLFYDVYIHLMKDEILEKYNINISDTNMVANYQKLYALLDKLGYVNTFYKKLYPKAKLLSSKVEKKIVSHPQYIELLKYFNSYKPFEDKVLFDIQDIDIERLIKTHIQPPFDVNYILEEYKKIKENHNYGIRI